MKSICFLAQFPPPMHGLSKAVDTLYNSRLKEKYHFSKIDITNNKRFLLSLLALMRCRSDVVYFTPSQTRGGNLRDLVFLKLIRWRGKKCIVHIHGGYYRKLVDEDIPGWQRRMNYHAVERLAGGIVLGHSLHGIFEGMLPDDKIFVCPNCVDEAYIASSIDEKMDGLKRNGVLHVLYLSNFIASKGYREVLEIARMASDKGDGDKFVFHFAGKFFDPREEEYFNEVSKDLGNVVYHGIVGGKDKADLLSLCNLFVLLTRYPNEGQPISILEAMGNGMAVVTTDHAGIPEIASRKNGFVCKKDAIDIQEIYHYLTACYNNRKKFSETCEFNFHMVRNHYTEQRYIDNMDDIFSRIAAE